MAIRVAELFHGALLAKLMRDEHQAVRLFEKASDERAVYAVEGLPGADDTIFFYTKHSASPRLSEKNGRVTWGFTFFPEHLVQLANLSRRGTCYVALVCGCKDLGKSAVPGELCLITAEELRGLVDPASRKSESLRVTAAPRQKLRVWGVDKKNPLKVSRNRIDELVERAVAA